MFAWVFFLFLVVDMSVGMCFMVYVWSFLGLGIGVYGIGCFGAALVWCFGLV